MEKRRKLLVVVVDRDDDLGRVGIRTPILGRDAVLDAAIRFALARPEDSDANVLFAGLRVLDELREKGYDANIVVVSGHPYDSVEADMRIRDQVRWASEIVGSREAILVSDGAEDELVLPVLQQVVNIVSVKRVVVEQHRGLEETLILLGRYVRKAVEEPRFARLFLGVPGLAIVVFSSLALAGYFWHAMLLGLLVAGLAMIVRGFGLEERVSELITHTPITLIAYVASGILAAVAIGLAAYQFSVGGVTIATIAETLRGVNFVLGLAATIAILSHAISKLVAGNIRVAREVTGLAIVVVLVALVNSIASALEEVQEVAEPSSLVNYVVPLLLQQNIVLYTLGGIVAIAVVWKVSSYIESLIAAEEKR